MKFPKQNQNLLVSAIIAKSQDIGKKVVKIFQVSLAF